MSTLSVLLWNVWNLPSCLTDKNSKGRAKNISPLLKPYDVVILNEAFVNKKYLLEQADYPYMKKLGRQWWTIFDSGIIILSRFPIVETSWTHYKQRSGWDIFAAKGILKCRIQLNDTQQIDVYGTHMQAGNTTRHQVTRHAQAIQAAEFVLKGSPAGNTVLFAGDLNMGPTKDPKYINHSVHYANAMDARLRTESYTLMCGIADLTDVVAQNHEEDINRFMIKDGTTCPISKVTLEYLAGQTPRLSDSDALKCTVFFSHDVKSHPI